MSRRRLALLLVPALLLAACGGDDGIAAEPDAASQASAEGADTSDDGDTPSTKPDDTSDSGDSTGVATGNGSTVTIGDEVIDLVLGPGCYAEPQDTAGGGTITLTIRRRGTNAAGEEVTFDFTRYDEESMFTGDDVEISIGEIDRTTGSYSVGTYTVKLDHLAAGEETVTATDFTWTSDDGLADAVGAFEIFC